MAQYAQIVNGKVSNVIDADALHIANLKDAHSWVPVGTLGKAHIGALWDGKGFKCNSPYPSWVFNKTTYTWNAPVAAPSTPPSSGGIWVWNEATKSWVSYFPEQSAALRTLFTRAKASLYAIFTALPPGAQLFFAPVEQGMLSAAQQGNWTQVESILSTITPFVPSTMISSLEDMQTTLTPYATAAAAIAAATTVAEVNAVTIP